MGIEDIFKGNIFTGLAVGVGVAVVAPMVTPILKPVGKTIIKAGIGVYEQGRVAFAEMNERTSDMIAEARSEMDEEQRGKRTPASPRPAAEPAKA